MKGHLNVDHDEHDSLIDIYTGAAVAHLEGNTGILGGRVLVSQVWSQKYDGFSSSMLLPFSPIIDITSVTYADPDGEDQTLASSEYKLVARGLGDYVEIAMLPSTDNTPITITFTAGYGAGSDVPLPLKQAVLLHVGTLYENREKDDYHSAVHSNRSYETLIAPYRRFSL